VGLGEGVGLDNGTGLDVGVEAVLGNLNESILTRSLKTCPIAL
jgi:hypothetical protein